MALLRFLRKTAALKPRTRLISSFFVGIFTMIRTVNVCCLGQQQCTLFPLKPPTTNMLFSNVVRGNPLIYFLLDMVEDVVVRAARLPGRGYRYSTTIRS